MVTNGFCPMVARPSIHIHFKSGQKPCPYCAFRPFYLILIESEMNGFKMPAGYPRPYARQLTGEDLRKRSIKTKLENEFNLPHERASKTSNFPFGRRRKQATQAAMLAPKETTPSQVLISNLVDFIEIYREVHADLKMCNSENNRHLAYMGHSVLSKWISESESTLSKNFDAISNGRFEEVTNEDALVIALRYAAQIVYMQDYETGLEPQSKVVDLLIHKLTSDSGIEENTASPTLLKAFEDLIFVLSDHANGRNEIGEFSVEMSYNIICAGSGKENVADSPVGLTID